MGEVQLTFYCAPADVDPLVDMLSSRSGAPVHVREELVRGRDYGDAFAAEQVIGRLQRVAIDIVVPAGEADVLVDAVRDVRRSRPVRWQTTPILARGRVE